MYKKKSRPHFPNPHLKVVKNRKKPMPGVKRGFNTRCPRCGTDEVDTAHKIYECVRCGVKY